MNEHGAAIEVPPRVLEFLGDNTTLTLATASPTGVPRATTLRYVNDGLNLYVWMRSQAWAAKQIEQNPWTLLEDKFFSNRAYVLVDPEGLVRWAYAEETPGTRRENDELLAQVLETHQRSA